MTQERMDIRHAIVAVLKDKTAAGDRVYANRRHPTQTKQLPAIFVYVPTERVTDYTRTPRRYSRFCDVEIECIDRQSAQYPADDLVDLLADDVERLLEINVTLHGTASNLRIGGEVRSGMDESGTLPLFMAIVPVEVEYIRAGLECDADAQPYFESLSIKYDLRGKMTPTSGV